MFIRPVIGEGSSIDYILQDTFTDTNGVLIPDHTGELFPAGGWTDEYGATPKATIQSNQFNNTRLSSPLNYYIDAGVADFTVVAKGVVQNGSSSTFGLMGRWAAGAFWQLEIGNVNNLKIINTTSDVASVAYSPALAVGVPRDIELNFSGNVITGSIDGGAYTVQTTNALRNTATVVGIRVLGEWSCDEIYVE